MIVPTRDYRIYGMLLPASYSECYFETIGNLSYEPTKDCGVMFCRQFSDQFFS